MKRLNQIVNKFNIYNVAASKFALFKCSSETHAGDLVLFEPHPSWVRGLKPDDCVIKDDWMEYQEIFYKEIGGLM